MFKTTLFFIMTFMMCLSAGARTFVRTHEDFVHLSEYQKNQHIIKVMELVVELESKYKFETRKYGYSQERFERFQKAISKISSLLFIDNAYAREIYPASVRHSHWEGLATRFGEILEQGNQNTQCIFAGWVSQTYQSGGKTLCGHPATMERAARGYPDPAPNSGCGRNNTNYIQCNPLIFGYKHSGSKSLFCVSTDNRAENSSFQCMKKSLGIITENGADPVADRLSALRTNLSNSPAVFNQVQEFVYRTCICDTTHGNFNRAYQEAIRPHRTCYGLMNMIGETVSCEDPSLPLQNRSIFENLKSRITEQNISGSGADSLYTQFLSELDRESEEYRRICQLQPETPQEVTYRCESATCSMQDPREGSGTTTPTLSCEYVVKIEGQETPVTFSEAPQQVPEDGATSVDITFKVAGASGTATCTNISRPQPTEQYQCIATCTIAAATPAETETEAPGTENGGTGSGNPSAPPPTEGAGAAETGTAATPALGCNVTSLKDSANQDVSHQLVSAPTAPAEPGESTLSFVLKINNEDKTVPCQTTTTRLPATGGTTDDGGEETDDTIPNLEVKLKAERDSDVDIEAIYQETEGWLFQWSTQSVPQGKTVANSWNPAEEEDAETSVAVVDDGSQNETTDTPAAPTSHGKNITQPRYDFDYKVCGTLTKGDKTSGPKCVTVKKKGSGSSADNRNRFTPNVNPNLQPGGQMIRGTSDASAIGIR